jgi:spermidine synthase
MNNRTILPRVVPMVLFFISGATALIYEVLWSKHLTLLFGSTTQAQTVVLAVFMGGLAIGNRIFGARAAGWGCSLVWYGCLEIAIGVYAFAFFPLYQAADSVFVACGSGWLDSPLLLLLLKGSLSIGLLLPPTILMGGTLPVLTAWLESQYPDAARWSVRFYSLNTFGAVLGAWLAGFLLVEWVGMIVSLQLTAAANILAGLVALGLGRSPEATSRAAGVNHGSSTAGSSTPELELRADSRWVGCWLVAFTGGVSIGLETLSSRALALVFGASLPAFSVMLISFILGIGLGSAVIASSRVRHWPRDLTTFALLLLAAGVMTGWVLAIGPGLESYRWLCTGLGRTEMGYRYQLILNTLMAILVLGLPAAFLGAV